MLDLKLWPTPDAKSSRRRPSPLGSREFVSFQAAFQILRGDPVGASTAAYLQYIWKAENARTLAPLLARSTPPASPHLPPRRLASVTCAESFLLAPESFCSFLVAK